MWKPKHGKRNRGRPCTRYIDALEKDTGIAWENVMENRSLRRQINEDACIRPTRWVGRVVICTVPMGHLLLYQQLSIFLLYGVTSLIKVLNTPHKKFRILLNCAYLRTTYSYFYTQWLSGYHTILNFASGFFVFFFVLIWCCCSAHI